MFQVGVEELQSVQNIWTIFFCGRNIVLCQIFKAHISREEKKRYPHSLWMNVPSAFHKSRVIAHAAVQGYQSIDAGISCRCRQARNSSPTPADHSHAGIRIGKRLGITYKKRDVARLRIDPGQIIRHIAL